MKKGALLPIAGLMLTGILSGCTSHNDEATNSTLASSPCTLTINHVPHNALGKLDAQIFQVGDEVKIILPSDAIYEPRSGEIQKSAYSTLDVLADQLKAYGDVAIQVTAYTDNLSLPIDNKRMTGQQARSLVTYLWTRGLNRCHLTPVGAGSDDLGTVASNRSIMGSMINRRIEITFRATPHLLAL